MTRGRLAGLFLAGVACIALGVVAMVSAPFAGVAVLGVGLSLAGLVGAAAVAMGWAWLARSNPRLDGEIRIVDGPAAPVRIRRDRLGTPYIEAGSVRDTAFGLGVAMAQDRLWQMDLLRRAASGRLAEIAGPEAVRVDAYVRTIGLRRTAEADEARLGAEERELLEGFAAGVNAVIGGALGGRAFEFRLLRYAPERWHLRDSLAIAKALGWMLSSSLEGSLLAWRVSDRIGDEAAAPLVAPPPPDMPDGIASSLTAIAGLERAFRETVGGRSTVGGSNVWALAGAHTRSGKPILANDVHLGNEYSLRFYEARIDGGGLAVSGLFVPGAPLPVAGTNGQIAWGPTNTGVAVSDVYLEELSADGSRSRHGDSWEPIETLVEEIAVRGRPARRLAVRTTRHGPIVSDLVPAAAPPPGTALALRWAGSELGPPANALLEVSRARDWETFEAACDAWTVPATTLGYADTDGHIGLRVAGAIPARPRHGVLPLDGADPALEWEGYLPASANPRMLDPEAGWLASANDAPLGADSSAVVTWLPEPPYRIRRIREMLGALVERGRTLTDVEMRLLQRDTLSAHALELLPRLAALLDRATLSDREAEALRHLDDWNGSVTIDSVASSIWEAWYREWLIALLAERLEPAEVTLALEIPRLNPGYIPWSLADQPLLDAWCRTTTPAELARRSFGEAVLGLTRRRGRDVNDWDWGSMHTATWTHPAGRSRLLAWLLNRGPFPVPGDAMTVNTAEFPLSSPYAATLLPMSRFIVDLGEPDRPRFATHPGQSAHPLSPHFDDRLQEFLRGDAHVTPARLDAASTAHTLRILPG